MHGRCCRELYRRLHASLGNFISQGSEAEKRNLSIALHRLKAWLEGPSPRAGVGESLLNC